MNQSALESIIKQLWKERANLVNLATSTEESKKNQREKLKIITDDLHKFLELYEKSKTDLRQQKLDLIRLQHESDVGFVDTDQTKY